ncbi:hypothetical protein [Halopenitus sp. POP-27]|uniref:hypothetical protein n=1 Tax=Halopenitus sp. POP-27 TaxID=2994425 RepID=UPI0024686656|nr:hypothetical protein [Halopenitus sp. POP-27]
MDADALADELRSFGVSVESLSLTAGTVDVTYLTAFPGETVTKREIGRACNALIDLAEQGRWNPQPVEATVIRAPGDVLGWWSVDPAWIDDLVAEELTETEFSTRVLETVVHDVDADAGDGPDTEADQGAGTGPDPEPDQGVDR